MAPSKKDKREHLFSIYAKNLSIYFPHVTNKFLCPICKRLFSRNDLDCTPPNITRAHIIPQSLRGTLFTLSCKQCNDKIGSKLELHLAKEKDLAKIKKGKGHLPIRIKTDHSEIGADLSFTNSKPLIRHNPNQSDPELSKKFIRDARKDWSKFKFSLRLKLPNPKKRNIALIHSAFLMMFYYFGYEYVLSPNVSPIRDFILDPKLWDPSYNRTIWTHNTTLNSLSLAEEVSIVLVPEEMRSFLIALPSPNESKLRCVLLPDFGKDGQKAYNRILAENFKSIRLNGKSIPYDQSRLTNPEFKWLGHNTWKSFSKI